MSITYKDFVTSKTSGKWFGTLVSNREFTETLDNAIQALQRLNKIKKTLFYGPKKGESLTPFTDNVNHLGETATESLFIHGVLGVATEGGELLENLRAYILKGDIDTTNLSEELGDCDFYKTTLCIVFGLDPNDIMHQNMAKLDARYKEGFTVAEAHGRDLKTERETLENYQVEKCL